MVKTENNFPHRAWKETHFHEHNNDRKKSIIVKALIKTSGKTGTVVSVCPIFLLCSIVYCTCVHTIMFYCIIFNLI